MTFAQSASVRRLFARNVTLHDMAAIREPALPNAKVTRGNRGGGEIVEAQIRTLPYSRVVPSTDAPALGGDGTVAIDDDAAYAQLKLRRRLKPNVVLQLDWRQAELVNQPSGFGSPIVATAKAPELCGGRAGNAILGGSATAISRDASEAKEPNNLTHNHSSRVAANKRTNAAGSRQFAVCGVCEALGR
jgi:hypothetical protein